MRFNYVDFTQSVDEFLSLQQVANIEVLKAVNLCGAQLALPTNLVMGVPSVLSAPLHQVIPETGSKMITSSGPDSIRESDKKVSAPSNSSSDPVISTSSLDLMSQKQQTPVSGSLSTISGHEALTTSRVISSTPREVQNFVDMEN